MYKGPACPTLDDDGDDTAAVASDILKPAIPVRADAVVEAPLLLLCSALSALISSTSQSFIFTSSVTRIRIEFHEYKLLAEMPVL